MYIMAPSLRATFFSLFFSAVISYVFGAGPPYPIVDTNQHVLYGEDGCVVDSVAEDDPLFGQDANYIGTAPHYTDKGDGTVYDENTGLLWEKAHHETRINFLAAQTYCEDLELGGKTDWRLPTLKEAFSIADFSGNQHSGRYYIDNSAFDFAPPAAVDPNDQAESHTVQMMGQTWTSNIYKGNHWDLEDVEAAFFFNFLDGHIKQARTGSGKLFYRCVSGNEWGVNRFVDLDDGTVKDRKSGLIWQQQDDGIRRNWQDAMEYCEGLSLAGKSDWRLPNVKELQNIVDYSIDPAVGPAIDPEFFTLVDEDGWFWSSTTHGDSTKTATYICFGKCVAKDGTDTHGAGAQRADPKTGVPSDYANYGGDQDDEVRINNYARCVRGPGRGPSKSLTTADAELAGNTPKKCS